MTFALFIGKKIVHKRTVPFKPMSWDSAIGGLAGDPCAPGPSLSPGRLGPNTPAPRRLPQSELIGDPRTVPGRFCLSEHGSVGAGDRMTRPAGRGSFCNPFRDTRTGERPPSPRDAESA